MTPAERITTAASKATAAIQAVESIREFERGRRFVAHHPDLVTLDAWLDRLYEQP